MDAVTEPGAQTADRCPRCRHEVGDAWLVCAWCGQPLAVAAELAAGTRLGGDRYQVLRVLGRGGFGITYDAGDRRLRRRVAVKELFPESAVRHGTLVLTPPQGRAAFKEARERFLREARVLARFTHPGIVRVYEVFEEHGTAYLVMELLEGRTLVDLLRERNRPFDESEVLDVAGRVAAALRPIHAAGVLHRDLNPSNVMMTHHGRIVLIDFGLARDYDQAQSVGMTRVVTPGYAPIEQYRGEGRFGPSTDVYGLAATLYRLSTGRVPVSALERDGGALLAAPRSLNAELSRSVSDAILDGLELEPTHRPQDIDAFLARLGIRHLPEGPRSSLLDAVPPPEPEPPLRAADLDLPVASTAGVAAAWTPDPDPDPVAAPVLDRRPDWEPAWPVRTEPDSDHTVIEPRVPAAAALLPAPAPAPIPSPVPTRHQGWDPDRTVVPDRPGAVEAVASDPDRTAYAGGTPVGADRTVADGGRDLVGGSSPGRYAPAPDVPGVPLPAVASRPAARRRVTVPLGVVALAVAMADPVLATLLMVVVGLPLLATLGDSEAQRLRAAHGVEGGWAERRLAPGALAPTRFFRNLVVSIVRASPVVGIGAVLLGGWYGLKGLNLPDVLLEVGLRVIGLGVVGALVALSRDGSSRFRTGLGLDVLAERLAPGNRASQRLFVVWVVAVILVAGSLWLTPDTFPLP